MTLTKRSMTQCAIKGYTLIEILIVIFIVSIVSSVALLSISHNENKQMESFASELAEMVTLAEEQAMLQPTVLGLLFQGSAFQFTSLESTAGKEKWVPLQDTILKKYHVPDDIQMDVEVGHLSSRAAMKNNPQIIISTNGDMTPFVIYISKKGKKPRYVVRGDADGSVTTQSLS